MNPSDIKFTPKLLNIFEDDSRIIHLEGTTGSSKSFILGLKFFFEVFNSDKSKKQFVIAASSITVAEKMFIDNPASFYNIFKPVCSYSKNGVGGSKIVIRTSSGDKTIYLVGYDDKSRYKSILGLGIHMFLVEEIQTCSLEFIRELFTRVFRDGGKLFTSSNGGIPELPVYTEYLNKCRPHDDYKDIVPDLTMSQLMEKDPEDGWRFWFMSFYDNPSMTKENIKALYTAHPKGSFEYNSKILGIRMNTDGVLYGHIMKDSHIIPKDKIKYNSIIDVRIGIDIGSSSGTNDVSKRASTVIVMSGFNRQYKKWIVLDSFVSNEQEHLKIVNEFNRWLYKWYLIFGTKIKGIYPDAAEPAFITTLRNNIQFKSILVKPSIKTSDLINLNTRVTIKEQYIIMDSLLWLDTEGGIEVNKQMKRVRGKNGKMLDEELIYNDYSDALDYSMTPVFKSLMNAIK